MIRTNGKKFKDKIREYIADSYRDYFEEEPKDPATAAAGIVTVWIKEKVKRGSYPGYKDFLDWCQGLPSALDTCYYYNRSAIEQLGDWLEETPEERAKYTEEQAEELITALLWRELNALVDAKALIING